MIIAQVKFIGSFSPDEAVAVAQAAALASLKADGIVAPEQAAKARDEYLRGEQGEGAELGELSKPGPWERAQAAAHKALVEVMTGSDQISVMLFPT